MSTEKETTESATVSAGKITTGSGTGTTWGGTITTTGGVTFSPGGTIKPSTVIKPRASKHIPAPTAMPRKILIAFLDENDEVQWCGKMHPGDLSVDFDSTTYAPELSLRVHLIEAD